MVQLTHRSLILLAGFIWLVIGIGLLSLGLHFLYHSLHLSQELSHFSLIDSFAHSLKGRENSFIALTIFALILGSIKGRTILRKTANNQIDRIRASDSPLKFSILFNRRYLILIGIMMLLGMVLRYLPIHMDVRGTIDLAIGAALIHGALHYFKSAYAR